MKRNQANQAIKAATASAVTSGDYLSIREAAQILKISEISIRRYLTQKKLRRLKVGSRTLIRSSEVLGLIREA
jgi:excisionase family DNA binding protein